MGSIELFIIFAVTALHLAIVPWSERTDQLVTDSQLSQSFFKKSSLFRSRGVEPIGKFRAVVRLNTLNGKGEFSDAVPDELSGRIGAVLLECLQIPKTAVFIQKGVLVVSALFGSSTDQTALRNIFDVDLDPLARITYLLIGFRNILGIWQFRRHLALLSQKTVQAGDGACIAPLPQLHPEDHQAGVRIPSAHVLDELDLFGAVLVWMAVRAMRAVFQ